MTKVYCPELNYLEAKERKERKLKWTKEQDAVLTRFATVDPLLLVPMLNRPLTNTRAVMRRQRELGVRAFTNRRTWKRS